MAGELTVTVQGNNTIRAETPDGSVVMGQLRLDSLDDSLIGVFDDWLQQDKISKRRELEVLGVLLYQALFRGEVSNFFDRKLKEVPAGDRLRVQLSFEEEAGKLARLPWEYLYRPDSEGNAGFFFATHVKLVLSRFLPLQSARLITLQPNEPPLRLLIVVSKPRDLDLVLDGVVVEAIQNLQKSYPNLLAIEVLEIPTMERFLEALARFRPQVLHFIGHGRFRPGGRGEIALVEAESQLVAWYPDQMFVEAFNQAEAMPRLVYLHACEGGSVDFTSNFAGLAPQMIRAGIQAVVAMQYPITNWAAISFSRAFYTELAKGRPVDYAVQAGRWRLASSSPDAYDNRVFGTPVLFMRSRDGLILPTGTGTETSTRTGTGTGTGMVQ